MNRTQIPWLLSATRSVLGPVLIAGAAAQWNPPTLAAIVVGALLSDIFDGVLARRWKCDTAAVRLFDTFADTVFYLSTAAALAIARPHAIRENAALLIALLAFEASRLVFDLVKFRKPASYHSYLAKTWGLVLALAIVSTFLDADTSLLTISLAIGLASNVEGLVMSLLLPTWHRDVRTLAAALHLRAASRSGLPQRDTRALRMAAFGALATLLTLPAFAVDAGQEAYVGGTDTSIPAGTIGTLNTAAPDALVFRFHVLPGPAAEIHIPYESIRNFQYSNEVAHHIGVLPAIAVSLVKKRERKHFVTLTYTDETNSTQVAVFELPKNDPPILLAILRARAPQVCGKMKISQCGGTLDR